MIQVYGRATSSNVQLVMWALGELGQSVERHDKGGAFGGLDAAEFGALNPNRLIPVLVDGDLTMWESAAILRYLAAAYGGETFWPRDPKARARQDMWADWARTSFAPNLALKIFWQLVRTREAERNQALMADGVATLKRLAPLLDAAIGAGPYLGGAGPSFADISCGHLLYRYYTLDFERAETPNLDAYYARLTERPAFAEHVMVSYESLRVT